MNDEKVLGIIPNMLFREDTKLYTVFVTTKRLILGIERHYEKVIGGRALISSELQNQGYYYSLLTPDQIREVKPDQILSEDKRNKEISYTHIIKVEFKSFWEYDIWGLGNIHGLIIWGLTKGLIKMKEKKLITGSLRPPWYYLEDKKSLGLSEKEIAKEYAIEIENLLSSVLKDKIVNRVDLQTKASFVLPSKYFSSNKFYPKLENLNKGKILNEMEKRREKNPKMERVQEVASGILSIMVGLIIVVGGYWLATIWGPSLIVLPLFFGGLFIIVGLGAIFRLYIGL